MKDELVGIVCPNVITITINNFNKILKFQDAWYNYKRGKPWLKEATRKRLADI